MKHILRIAFVLMCISSSGVMALGTAQPNMQSQPSLPSAIPTFHCLSLYWSPPGGSSEREVQVRYRRQGASAWADGLAMRFNPIEGTEEDIADYRGSIVHLQPGVTYELQLTLSGTATTANLKATTWREAFPAGETVKVENRNTPLSVTESGSPTAWRVYDGHGAMIDVRHQYESCITVDASYVILRGFTLKGAGKPSDRPKGTIGAIHIEGGHDIIIEDCDISDWGRLNPETGFAKNMDAAIYSRSSKLEHLIIQRNKIHNPTYDGSTWYEPKYPTHTMGTQCITLSNTAGNHVIRYNEFWSDMDHMYNDIVGGASNGSYHGAPGPDSDIYGNHVSHCWDDGLEVEGGNRNVRVWDNYIAQSAMMIGNAATSIGPLYIWCNVVSRSQWKPGYSGGNFLKMGFAGGEQWMTGHQYIFHNTLFRGEGYLPRGGLGGTRIVKHTVSRNNILHVRSSENWCASENENNMDNNFDYDLYNGRIPKGHESHGVFGEPVYSSNSGYNFATKTGKFQLMPNSPGSAAGEKIPNFSKGFTGAAPDMGAHQRGEPIIQYGVSAQ